MIRVVCLLAFLAVLNFASAQHQDCSTAYRFTDSLGVIDLTKGTGNELEIKGNNIKNKYLFTKEHNTAWVIIDFTNDGLFQFELTPQYKNEDFDFAIFKYYGTSTCDSIKQKNVLPIRSNLARRNPTNGSVTGLKKDAENLYAAAGPNTTFSKSVSVKKGSSLLLIIDAPYTVRGGFAIKNNSAYTYEIRTIEITEKLPEPPPVPKKVTIHVVDKDGNIIPNPSIYLKSLSKIHRDNPTVDADGNVYSENFKSSVKQRILITQKGYVQTEFNFKWSGITDTIVEVPLLELTKGMKLQFENILFSANSANIKTESKEDLEKLTLFLKSNPQIYVEVGGHIYSAKRRNKRKFVKLSNKRAKVIYEHLVSNGIDPKNMTYKGYGNSQMLYKLPKSSKEYQANRRVELTITKIK